MLQFTLIENNPGGPAACVALQLHLPHTWRYDIMLPVCTVWPHTRSFPDLRITAQRGLTQQVWMLDGKPAYR
jgi:hypothetical protein